VVKVLVGVEEDLDVRGIEPERLDVADDLVAGGRVAAVDLDQAGLGDDQIGRIVRRADIIEPLADLERRVGRVGRRRRLGGCENGRREGDRSEELWL
jgi:hypothetical protein